MEKKIITMRDLLNARYPRGSRIRSQKNTNRVSKISKNMKFNYTEI